MKELFYKTLYYPPINRIILLINRILVSLISLRIPPSGIINLSIDHIHFKLAVNQTSYVGKLLFWDGPNNFEYTNIFIHLITRSSGFMDIGSNIGYYSVLAGAVNPGIHIHAFEPAKGPNHYLKKNIELNNLAERVQIHQLALSDRKGSLNFFESINPKYPYLKYHLGGTGSLLENKDTASAYQVETITLDDFVRTKDITNLDIIKLDTEGTEHEILSGANEVIRKFRPIVICEILFDKIERQLEFFFLERSYKMFYPFENELIEVQRIIRQKDDGVRNCFFVPEEKVNLIKGLIK